MKSFSGTQVLVTFIPSFLILVVVIIVNRVYGVSVTLMTRDVSTIGNIHPLAGFVSSLGILLWAATVTSCLFSSIFLFYHGPKTFFRFLLYGALLSAYLLFDDLFCIHERSGRWLPGGEKTIVMLLGLAVLVHLIMFKRIILQSNFLMLVLALGFLFISNVIDSLQPYLWEKGDLDSFLEDGTKWIGIVCWSSYYIETSYKLLKNNTINQ